MRLSSDFPIQCPGCSKQYSVPENMAGADVTCGACGSDFSIPIPPSPTPSTASTVPVGPISTAPLPAMAPAEADPAPSGDALLPAPVTSSNPGTTAPSRPRWIAPALLVFAGAAAVLAGAEWLQNREVNQENATAPAPLASITSPSATGSSEPLPGRFIEKNTRTAPPEPIVPDQMDSVTAQPEEQGAGSPETEAPPAATMPPVPVEPEPEPAAGSPLPADPALIRRDPRQTLDHFLAATSMEGRLVLSQNPEKIRAAMEARRQNEPPKAFPAVMVDLLTTGNVPGSQRSFLLYNVFLKNRSVPIPVAVEKTSDGYRVDWQTFIECHDEVLKKFFGAPSSEPSRFRVSLRRAHYFGPPVPGQDRERIAYKVEAPTRDESFYVWADKNSRLFKDQLSAGGRGGWDAESYVIAELRWRGDDRQGRWVGLEKITSDSWRPE